MKGNRGSRRKRTACSLRGANWTNPHGSKEAVRQTGSKAGEKGGASTEGVGEEKQQQHAVPVQLFIGAPMPRPEAPVRDSQS